MIAFIIPLQSKSASKRWELVCSLFRRTLNSVLSQTSPDFHVIVVCDDIPDNFSKNPNLTVICKDFPKRDLTISENRMLDKWDKVAEGIECVRKLLPCHVMVVDADDLVSNQIARFCLNNPNEYGWYFNKGWLHDEGSNFLYLRRNKFDQICGTSSIVRLYQSDFPIGKIETRDDCFVLKCGHTKIKDWMDKRGTPLKPLPFIGSIYMLGTGENHTGFSLKSWKSIKVFLKKMLFYRIFKISIRNEFSFIKITN